MTGKTTSFYINDHNNWIIQKALEHCKKTEFTFKNKLLSTESDILKLGLEMVRQYFHITKPVSYKELKNLDSYLNENTEF